jgi:hypothetical protein
MRWLIALFLILFPAVPVAFPQEDFASASVDDVRQFVEFEIAGGRITDNGWQTANKHFFLNTRGSTPELPPKERNVLVVSDKFHVRLETYGRNTDTTVEASFDMCYGRVDSQLKFSFMDAGTPGGVAVPVVCASEFELTGSRIIKAHIGQTDDAIMLSRAAAIKYVTEKREHTQDPAIRKNADSALAILRKSQQAAQ